MAVSLLSKCCSLRILHSPIFTSQPSRSTTSKHWNPKYKKLRAQKVFKIDLPDYNEELSRPIIRQKMKERGIDPPRPWLERQFYVACTGGVFEPYVPPEGDGKASLVSGARAKQAVQAIEKKSKSMMAIRKIKSFEDDFGSNTFCDTAQKIYLASHESLLNGDKHSLRQQVTEHAYPQMRHNTFNKTIRWRFIQSLEPPRLVHARCTDVISKDNIFGQVTVRFHTQQMLAVYDRFGRLMHGSEIIAKDVLEYVVFEKHLSYLYGTWRLHDKIIPDWAPPKDPTLITRVLQEESSISDETDSLPAPTETS